MSNWKVFQPISRIFGRKGDKYEPIVSTKAESDALVLPPFIDAALEWLGASSVVRQYNYVVGGNFTITRIPKKPNPCDFCVCIRYRIGTTVYRYKLWSGIGEILYAPLYNGEIIKKNCVLEIWHTPQATLTNPSSLSFKLSLIRNESPASTLVQEDAAALPFNGITEELHYTDASIHLTN